MSSSSARRGQVEPTAALAAVFGVVVGLGLYAGALGDVMPDRTDRALADPAVERVHDALTGEQTAADPNRLSAALAAGPDRYRINVTLTVATERWSAGPTPPDATDAATRETGVRLAPGRVRAGVLRVEVWT
jgi:hypothetical protein